MARVTGRIAVGIAIGMISGAATATTTVTALKPTTELATFVTTTSDPFDSHQGGMITDQSGPTYFSVANAIGAVNDGGERTNTVFVDPGFNTFSFKTPNLVNIKGFDLYVADDGDTTATGASRGYRLLTVSASRDSFTYTDLATFFLRGNSYTAGYGSNVLRLTSTFTPTDYEYFRVTGLTRNTGTYFGGRILEIDGEPTAVAAAPEPAAWATMMTGFGLAGLALRRRRRARAEPARA